MTKLIGINHVAIEVGDLEEALELYQRLFEVRLRGRAHGMAFIDMGDQFLAVSQGRTQGPDEHRHFGLVVDDVDAVREACKREGLTTSGRGSVTFRDPWGNQFQVVAYQDIQFERSDGVRRALGIEELSKSPSAVREIEERGLG